MKKEATIGSRIAFVVIAVLIIAIAAITPSPEGLSGEGKMALAILLAGIVLWVAEPIPIAISALGLMVILPFFGVIETASVWTSFISSVIFFILASFGITCALLKTKIPTKIVFFLFRFTKGRVRPTILAFMIAAGIVSLFVSDIPCTALFAGIAMSSILELEKAEPGKSSLGRTLMIGVAWGSVVGGQAMPSGSSLNIMAMGMIESNLGVHMTFLQWTLICLPIAVILLIVCWLSLILLFKPEAISQTTIEAIEKKARSLGKLDALDIKVLVIMALVFVAWIASNWTGWDATTIAVFGCVAFFIPGIDALTWKEYLAGINWAIVLLIGGVQAIAGGISKQGSVSWILSSTVGKAASGATIFVIAAAVMLPLLRLAIPVGPAYIGICLIPLSAMAETLGVSVVALAVMVAINGSTTFLLGIDNNPMLTHSYGYWTMGDYFKAGIMPTIAMILCHSFLLVPLVTLVGF